MIQRQPRHHDLLRTEFGRGARCIDVRGEDSVGDHHALRFARRAARVLQDHQPLRIVRRNLQSVARRIARARHHRRHQLDRRVARTGLVERGEGVVDQYELRVAMLNPAAGALDEGLQRRHSHRQRQHHARDPAQPAALDDRHQWAARRAQDRDVIARHEAASLQCRPDGAGLVVDLAPRDETGPSRRRHGRADETDTGRPVGRLLQTVGDGTSCQSHRRRRR